MKLSVLVDNNTIIDKYLLGEPAVSYFLEDGDKRILFDVGYSDIFIHNAKQMNIDLFELDYLILSHGHLDHTWGLKPLINLYSENDKKLTKKPKFVAHPDVFARKVVDEFEEIGVNVSQEDVSKYFSIDLHKEPVWLTDKLVFLGEIKRKNDFEAQTPIGKTIINNKEQDDYVIDDTALAYKSDKGLVIIVGCAHAGICNIVEQAKKICNENRIVDIVGGLHLLNPSEKQLKNTLKYLKELKVDKLHACHCTDLESKIALSSVSELKEVGVGLTIEYK